MTENTGNNDYQQALSQFLEAANASADQPILGLFDTEPDRLDSLSFEVGPAYFDFSRHRLPLPSLPAIEKLVTHCGLNDKRAAMFAGETINPTEQRAVFHVALRAAPDQQMRLGTGGELVSDEIQHTLERMRTFSAAVRDGQWLGASGQRITDIVNVGIGGSQLGPLLACDALEEFTDPAMRVHFLANIDPMAWSRIKRRINADTTMVVIASKSWKTIETARNAQAVRQWLLDSGIAESALHRHLVGVTANPEGARAFGLSDDGIFPFRDWVGGRYSLWSAIGLPVMLMIGPANFDAMLTGARQMDQHFLNAPWDKNAPVLMAALSLWNAAALKSQTEAVIPYTQALARLPAYLQQLQMESNGKSVDLEGERLLTGSSPVIWGEPGTDAQHSFFQSLHQGTQVQPVDFVLLKDSCEDAEGRGLGLLANALAQSEALLHGQVSPEDPHRRYDGNRPSSTILLDELTPETFGFLIALYEHKTAALGWMLRINSFDQWGVELGKKIATKHEALLRASPGDATPDLDPSTRRLLEKLRP
ncbi:MAG: glucose-6-phosphate isomerase [Burkholderiaceae bacterium]